MSGGHGLRAWLALRLLSRAAAALGRTHPGWAQAMAGETEYLSEAERLRWAAGCFGASLRLSPLVQTAGYGVALIVGVAALSLYQWSADEGVVTLLLTGAIGLGLGLFSPGHFRLSGVIVGAVVTGVNAFETLTGVRPEYEVVAHSLVHDLRWLILVAPAVFTAALGRAAALHLKSQP